MLGDERERRHRRQDLPSDLTRNWQTSCPTGNLAAFGRRSSFAFVQTFHARIRRTKRARSVLRRCLDADAHGRNYSVFRMSCSVIIDGCSMW